MPRSESSSVHFPQGTQGRSLAFPGYVQNMVHPPNSPNTCSLTTASIAIGKAMADRNRTTFRAQGTCMYPCVRPGDLLHIESRTVEEIEVGDIAVCRRSGYLFSHRVIKKIMFNDTPAVVTKPDRSTHSSDAPTFDQDILGVVTVIVRKNKRHTPKRPRYFLPIRLYLAACLVIIEINFRIRQRLIPLLTSIQCTTLYERLARFYLAMNSAKVSYVVQLPLNAGQRHDLFHPVNADEFDVTASTWKGRPPDCWTLSLYLKDRHRPVGKAAFVLQSSECRQPDWQVTEIGVRMRYHGFGFEKQIISKANDIFARSGVKFNWIKK